MQVSKRNISDLIFDPSNARNHDEKNLAAIKGSLAKFGQQKPLVVSSKNIVIAGNGTLAAAKALGWTEIDVVVSELGKTEQIAFALADNRTSDLSEFNPGILSDQLKALLDEEFDIEAFGFSKDEIIAPNLEDNEKIDDLKKEYLIVIECDSENQQRDIFEELSIRELKCKIM